jgi:hypothetical protein
MVQECEELILDPNLRLEAPLNSRHLVRTQTEGSIKSLKNLTELQEVLIKTKNQAALVITHNLRSVRKHETINSILNNNAKLVWPPTDFIISQQWA